MDIKARVHQLVEESDEQILKAVEALLSSYQNDSWPEAEINRLNKDIKMSEDEFEKGTYVLNEDVLKLSSEWRKPGA